MSSKIKLKLFSLPLLICYSLLAQAQIATVDPCESIAGSWQGFWNSPYARCFSSVNANIKNNNGMLTIYAHTSPSSFPNRCEKTEDIILDGSCKEGNVTFKWTAYNIKLSGIVNKNEIRLHGEDEIILLNRS